MTEYLKTKYIGIESICVEDQDYVTIACNIILERKLYDEPIYTNIFCMMNQLNDLLKRDGSLLAKEIMGDLATAIIISDKDVVQIDLPAYVDHKIEWDFKTMINLKIAKTNGIPFQCYTFVDEI